MDTEQKSATTVGRLRHSHPDQPWIQTRVWLLRERGGEALRRAISKTQAKNTCLRHRLDQENRTSPVPVLALVPSSKSTVVICNWWRESKVTLASEMADSGGVSRNTE